MTIKRAVLITLLSASVVGLLAIGIKTNSFSKENIKNSFKLQNNSSHKYRKAPIRVNADNQGEIQTSEINFGTTLVAENTQSNITQKQYYTFDGVNTNQTTLTDFANIKYTSYDRLEPNNNISGAYDFYHIALYEINNYKYSTMDITEEIPKVTISPNYELMPTRKTAQLRKRAYIYDNFNTQYFNLNISYQNILTIYDYIANNQSSDSTYQEITLDWLSWSNQSPSFVQFTNFNNSFQNIYINRGVTKYIIFAYEVTFREVTIVTADAPEINIYDRYTNPVYNQEVVDITGLMLDILTMPFSFITTAFNVTLWEGTPYQFNFSNFVLSLIAVATLLFIIKLFTSGMGAIGNFTKSTNKSKPQKPKKKE